MKYTIFQVDDSRQHYVEEIRNELDGWEEVSGLAVDGRVPEQLAVAQEKYPYEIIPNRTIHWPRFGHLGIWYGVLNALELAPIVTFEDDAILLSDWFRFEFDQRIRELPNDADFFALFTPRDSDHMFKPRHDYGRFKTCRVYQPYGGVSMYYTERGADRIKKLIERDGLRNQYDNTLMGYSWNGELKGYTSKPRHPDLVKITGQEVSIIQESDLVD